MNGWSIRFASNVALLAFTAALARPVAAQINSSGRWRITIEADVGPLDPIVEEWQQSGNTLTASGAWAAWVGNIDPTTGEFDQTVDFQGYCPPDIRQGTVAADGRTFTATGIAYAAVRLLCVGFQLAISGTRLCGDGLVEAEEQCDDGNLDDGDGCSFLCEVEQCFACAGEPSTCAPANETPGAACDDGDSCTVDDTCDENGICTGVQSQPACVGDCNCDGTVGIDELVLGVSIVMSGEPPTRCPAFDPTNAGRVTISDIVRGALNAIHSCPL